MGQFDAVVAIYHDQGLIPVKLLHFDEAVNVTLGLPFPRIRPTTVLLTTLPVRGAPRLTASSRHLIWRAI